MGGAVERMPPAVQDRSVSEPCRLDLREHACFPYPPVENQGSGVTCVAHSFATALYCANHHPSSTAAVVGLQYSHFDAIFAEALRESPNKERGVSFEAVARGVERVYGADARMRSHSFQTLPNNAASLRAVLTLGAPIITGYQVDGRIHEFHRDAKACEALGFLLPRFDASIGSISGHAVLILGYDFRAQAFIARNSWGRAWGVDGHFLVPFAAVEDPEAFTDMWALLPRRQ